MGRRRFRTTIPGYMPADKLHPERDFVLHRRGPVHTTIGQDLHDEAMEYAEAARILATVPEALVHWALTVRHLIDGVHYDFQSSLAGGRQQLGGCVVDFLFLDRPLAVRVMGNYWHVKWEARGVGASDEEQRLYLEGLGYVVEDIWEKDILDADWLEDWMRRMIDQPVVRGTHGWQP